MNFLESSPLAQNFFQDVGGHEEHSWKSWEFQFLASLIEKNLFQPTYPLTRFSMTSRKIIWLLSFLSFIAYAVSATEIGPALSEIRSEFMLNETIAGVLASLQSLAGVLAILGGVLSDIFGKTRLVSFSLILMGLGTLAISSSPHIWILAAALFVFGSGTGFFEASVNAFVSEVFQDKRGMAINLLHIGWNIGSTIGPLLAAYAILTYGTWRFGYLLVSPFLIVLFIATWILARGFSRNRGGKPRDRRGVDLKIILRVLPLMIIPFLIVAAQLGLTTWLPSILTDQGMSIAGASLTVGLFWALCGVGRLVWAPFIDRLGYWRVLVIAGGCSALLMFLTTLPSPIYVRMMLWACAGFIIGPAYPTTVAWITASYPEIGGTLSGTLFTFSTLGSFASAIIVGTLFDAFGSVIAQFFFPLPILVAALLSYLMRGIGNT